MGIMTHLFSDRIFSVMNEDDAALFKSVDVLRAATKYSTKTDDDVKFAKHNQLKLIEGFISDLTAHFGREEGLMRHYDYPFVKAHISEHRVLLVTVECVHLRLRNDGLAFSSDVVDYINGWLVRHIGCADRDLATFLMGCCDKRQNKRSDLSKRCFHSLAVLFSVHDNIPDNVVTNNRNQWSEHATIVEDRHLRKATNEEYARFLEDQKRLQDAVWYE
ncbi:MAG: hemerythrin family protein [Rhodospirillaceae bacterium]